MNLQAGRTGRLQRVIQAIGHKSLGTFTPAAARERHHRAPERLAGPGNGLSQRLLAQSGRLRSLLA